MTYSPEMRFDRVPLARSGPLRGARQSYDSDRVGVFQDLITGVPNTLLVQETHELWQLADEIRLSPALTAGMIQHQDDAFFAALASFDEGRVFLAHYQSFLRNHGHRGHPDRDMYYSRRVEDPALDSRAFKALHVAGTERRPQEIERELLARRQAATEAVVPNLVVQPLAGLKAEMFKSVLNYTHLSLKFRDDERHYLDRLTLQKKRTFAKFGRRLRVLGLLRDADSHYFLARHELYELADRRAALASGLSVHQPPSRSVHLRITRKTRMDRDAARHSRCASLIRRWPSSDRVGIRVVRAYKSLRRRYEGRGRPDAQYLDKSRQWSQRSAFGWCDGHDRTARAQHWDNVQSLQRAAPRRLDRAHP